MSTASGAAAATGTLEPVAEIKFGQVGIANLKLKRLDPDGLLGELRDKVAGAEKLFLRAPVVLDLSHLPSLPALEVVRDLLERIRSAGMLPVGLSYGTSENERIAVELGIPVIAKFRAAYERAGEELTATPAPAPARASEAATVARADAALPTAVAPPAATGMLHDKPVRSGPAGLRARPRPRADRPRRQRRRGDRRRLDPCLRRPARTRARRSPGDEGARIFCREFHAELVSIAGQYRVFEDIPKELRGQPVQAWLEGDKLLLKKL